ncbi:MAG TPA: septal ring lytic transglycosylase RlpA family protein [Stellaceae bacterium]|nr:septal ring lytic transglycosylase RlpA family protein [Stellaceae bacterium]
MVRSAVIVMVFALCAAPAFAKTHPTRTEGAAERGVASTYSMKLVGHRTASGAKLDAHQFTAAHPSLPLGTKLLVTNRKNGRRVVVTVNDRGPFLKGRIIDLSPAAAAEIGMKRAGLAPVEIRVASER